VEFQYVRIVLIPKNGELLPFVIMRSKVFFQSTQSINLGFHALNAIKGSNVILLIQVFKKNYIVDLCQNWDALITTVDIVKSLIFFEIIFSCIKDEETN
jgi:hypothetical protein